MAWGPGKNGMGGPQKGEDPGGLATNRPVEKRVAGPYAPIPAKLQRQNAAVPGWEVTSGMA
jgi:hypothetical protein